MITREEYVVIHTLYKQGYSIRGISKIIGLDRRTISKRLKQSESVGYKTREYKSKLDPFKDYINKRIGEAYPDKIPAAVIYREIAEFGYGGKIRILQNCLSEIYHKPLEKEGIIRFETQSAFQAQVDWSVSKRRERVDLCICYGFRL